MRLLVQTFRLGNISDLKSGDLLVAPAVNRLDHVGGIIFDRITSSVQALRLARDVWHCHRWRDHLLRQHSLAGGACGGLADSGSVVVVM